MNPIMKAPPPSPERLPLKTRLRLNAPAPIVVAVLVFALLGTLGWALTESHKQRLLERQRALVENRLNRLGSSLASVISRRQGLVTALVGFAELHGGDASIREEFALFAGGLHANDPLIRAIQLLPQHGTELAYPLGGNEAVLSRSLQDLITDDRPQVRADVERAIATRVITLSNPYELRQGGMGVVARQAVFRQNRLWGLAVVILDIKPLLDRAGLQLDLPELRLCLSDTEGKVFYGERGVLAERPVQCQAPLPEGAWNLSAVPRAGWPRTVQPFLTSMRVSALVLALLLASVAYAAARRQVALTQTVRSQSHELGERNSNYRQLFEEAEAARHTADTARTEITETLERISDGFATLNQDWRYTFVNPKLAQLVGRPREQMVGQSIWSVFPEAKGTPVHDAYRQAVAEQRTIELEHFYEPLGRWFRHRFYPSSSGLSVFFQDITVRKRAEEETRVAQAETKRLLQEAELSRHALLSVIEDQKQAEKTMRLQGAALQAAANAVVITDRWGTIEWVNPAFTDLSGWRMDEVVGKNPRVLKSGKHDAAFYNRMWETLLAGRVWRGEIVNQRADNARRTEEMTITPLRDATGEITHYIAIKQDITEQKALEQQFLQAQRMEAIGTLAGGIAHDLNNILAPVLMIAGILKDKLPAEDDRDMLAMMETSAKRGANIVKQLLAFSRGHLGEKAVVQPRHLIKDMVQMMRETFPRELDLRHRTAGDLWTIVADPTQLHQVLLNLCVNARDAMSSGGRLTVGAENAMLSEGDGVLPSGGKPGPYVAIEVRDTGTGIPAEIKHRIFDPFFTTKEIGKGTGLGLSTVLAIVQNHGGFISVDSAPAQGTTFKVFLPANPDGVETASHVSASLKAPANEPVHRPMILLVDDEREGRDAIRIVLERNHFQVVPAANGADALTQYLKLQTEITLVLTDLMMPVMNGIAFIRALRAIDPHLKIIAMTGLNEVAQQRELDALGVSDVLMKPYDAAALFEVVRRQLPTLE